MRERPRWGVQGRMKRGLDEDVTKRAQDGGGRGEAHRGKKEIKKKGRSFKKYFLYLTASG